MLNTMSCVLCGVVIMYSISLGEYGGVCGIVLYILDTVFIGFYGVLTVVQYLFMWIWWIVCCFTIYTGYCV
jgi:hypothetical protein